MKKYTTKYWFAGMKKPSKLPKGCENYEFARWFTEIHSPVCWGIHPRRWRVPVKTCKWTTQSDGKHDYYRNPHTGEWFNVITTIQFCPTCGKPVEIVEKKGKQ